MKFIVDEAFEAAMGGAGKNNGVARFVWLLKMLTAGFNCDSTILQAKDSDNATHDRHKGESNNVVHGQQPKTGQKKMSLKASIAAWKAKKGKTTYNGVNDNVFQEHYVYTTTIPVVKSSTPTAAESRRNLPLSPEEPALADLLTEDERQAIYDYTCGDLCDEMNSALRRQDAKVPSHIEEKVQLITKGLREVFCDPGCFSTSTDESAAMNFMREDGDDLEGIMFSITYKMSGKAIHFLSGCRHEAEVLYPSSTKFIITKHEGNKVFMTKLVEDEVEESVVSLLRGAEEESEAAIISITVFGPPEDDEDGDVVEEEIIASGQRLRAPKTTNVGMENDGLVTLHVKRSTEIGSTSRAWWVCFQKWTKTVRSNDKKVDSSTVSFGKG
ncbi:ADP-ribosyltransferase exoenzyme [Nitzschia inconspicua]|uniref:ADP-ribosyltransferase exoenzyme n=1 Tax=Nitzschia inconspicua TaxID=303405 RepID=A0A9K3PYF2_9STRA|nr:ADP-ribosyltransferase exoenzyme [Nitzschia inconspicua]